MKRNLVLIWLALAFCCPGPASAQTALDLTESLIRSYDLLEEGKVDEAQKLFEGILKQDPGNPLALNNLAAVLAKKGDYEGALKNLQQALPRSKDYKVKVNRVCDVRGICLAFRPLNAVYADQELEPLIRLNIAMIQGRLGKKR